MRFAIGRYGGGTLWIGASEDRTHDGVASVLVGSNDWASAWARDETGRELLPIGRGFAGKRQREISYRFGVNLIMHVLTGNYKSDQVHVPALLDRLGQ